MLHKKNHTLSLFFTFLFSFQLEQSYSFEKPCYFNNHAKPNKNQSNETKPKRISNNNPNQNQSHKPLKTTSITLNHTWSFPNPFLCFQTPSFFFPQSLKSSLCSSNLQPHCISQYLPLHSNHHCFFISTTYNFLYIQKHAQ